MRRVVALSRMAHHPSGSESDKEREAMDKANNSRFLGSANPSLAGFASITLLSFLAVGSRTST